MNEGLLYLDDDDEENQPELASQHSSPLPVFNNFWWSSENSSKCCVYGCIANLLHHMGATEDAQSFKSLVTLDDASMLRALELPSFPKAVVSNTVSIPHVDKLQLCLWLLRVRYKVTHTRPMDVEKFTSVKTLVDNLMQFKFPVILVDTYLVHNPVQLLFHQPVSYRHLTLPTIYSV